MGYCADAGEPVAGQRVTERVVAGEPGEQTDDDGIEPERQSDQPARGAQRREPHPFQTQRGDHRVLPDMSPVTAPTNSSDAPVAERHACSSDADRGDNSCSTTPASWARSPIDAASTPSTTSAPSGSVVT